MDITTILGIVLAFVFMIIGIFWGGGALPAFVDESSVMITIGGTLAGILSSYTISDFMQLPKIMGNAFKQHVFDPIGGINTIVTLANIARKEGMLALEEKVNELEEDFLKKGVMLVVDGTDPELVKNIMEAELGAIESRHQKGVGMVELIGALGPAYGMLGTLIGLIIMLGNLSDPSALGSGMAAALVTTFYGSIIANTICIPIAAKLKVSSGNEMLYKEILLEGLLSIQAGENPRIIEEKLYSFLPRAAKEQPKKEDDELPPSE
ncbi:MAG: motility protein A [Oscillospiraceae bacterium]|jgi:chemotaxis protein MotA|nr:motility protein A [Oscillospiraceae bacterium]